MALNLDSKQAIEYSERSGGLNLIDFEAYGNYVLLFAGLEEHEGPEETGSKQADLLHVLVVSYEPTEGSQHTYNALEGKTLYFDQEVKGKAKPMAEAEYRCALAAVMGQTPTDPEFSAMAARKTLLKATAKGEVDPHGDPMLFCLSRKSKPGKKGTEHEGKVFADDLFSVYTAE